MTDKQIHFLKKHIPVLYDWKWKFERTREVYWLFLKKHPHIKKWYSTKSKYGSQICFHYVEREGRTINNLNDYKLFIAQENNG